MEQQWVAVAPKSWRIPSINEAHLLDCGRATAAKWPNGALGFRNRHRRRVPCVIHQLDDLANAEFGSEEWDPDEKWTRGV